LWLRRGKAAVVIPLFVLLLFFLIHWDLETRVFLRPERGIDDFSFVSGEE
jgi:hypothetical protein